jgi:hypothetical protein
MAPDEPRHGPVTLDPAITPSGLADEIAWLRETRRLVQRHLRHGWLRVYVLLVRRGWTFEAKRMRRLWNSLGVLGALRLGKLPVLGPEPRTRAINYVQHPYWQFAIAAGDP